MRSGRRASASRPETLSHGVGMGRDGRRAQPQAVDLSADRSPAATPRARLCHGPRPAFGEGTALPLRPARTAPTWPFQAPPAGRAAPHVLPRSGLGRCSWPGRSSGEGARRPRARQRHTRADDACGHHAGRGGTPRPLGRPAGKVSCPSRLPFLSSSLHMPRVL